jgi:hypothetical protein
LLPALARRYPARLYLLSRCSHSSAAAISKSIVQTSPPFTPRIFVLHAVKHQGAVERNLIAEGYVGILIGDFQ